MLWVETEGERKRKTSRIGNIVEDIDSQKANVFCVLKRRGITGETRVLVKSINKTEETTDIKFTHQPADRASQSKTTHIRAWFLTQRPVVMPLMSEGVAIKVKKV